MCRRENGRWGMNSLDYLLSRRAATMADPWLSHASSLLVLASLCCPVSSLSQIRAQLLYVFNSHCAPYCMVIYLSLCGMPHFCPLQLYANAAIVPCIQDGRRSPLHVRPFRRHIPWFGKTRGAPHSEKKQPLTPSLWFYPPNEREH